MGDTEQKEMGKYAVANFVTEASLGGSKEMFQLQNVQMHTSQWDLLHDFLCLCIVYNEKFKKTRLI